MQILLDIPDEVSRDSVHAPIAVRNVDTPDCDRIGSARVVGYRIHGGTLASLRLHIEFVTDEAEVPT